MYESAVDKRRIARAVGRDRYRRGRCIAWARAAQEGKTLSRTEHECADGQELFDIVADVLDIAFAGADKPTLKMRTVCALYSDFPSYTLLAQLFMNVGYDELAERDRTFFFRFLATMLSSVSDELAEPASYQLWVDFFEAPDRVDRAWHDVIGAIVSDHGWKRLLQASGPVPERLKLPLIERFVEKPSFHDAVLIALSAGVFDLYGDIARSTVDTLLPKLRVDTTAPRVVSLLERLRDPKPIEFGWSFQG